MVGPRTVVIHAGQLLGVGDRGRQAHQAHRRRQVDDHLLPHRPAVGVLEEVHLVEDDDAEAVERRRAAVDHVAEDLGGHHDDRGVAVDGVVAGQEADPSAPWMARRSWNFWFDSALMGAV